VRRETGPAPAAKPAGLELGEDCVRSGFTQGPLQGPIPVVAKVLIQVQGVDLSAVLGGDVDLVAQEVRHSPVSHVDRVPCHRLPSDPRQQPIHGRGDRARDPASWVPVGKVSGHDRSCILRLDPGVQKRRTLPGDDLQQRGLVAHAHAPDPLDCDLRPGLGQGLVQGLPQPAAAPGHAAGPQAKPDLPSIAVSAGRPLSQCGPGRPGPFMPKEVVHHLGHGLSGHVPIGDPIDLHGRGQRAAAQACDPLHGEEPLRVRVPPVRDLEVSPERIQHLLRPLDVAGRAHTHMDDMPAHWLMAEPIVKGRDTDDLGRRDVGPLADPLQGLLGQVSEPVLQGVQDLEDLVLTRARPGHDLLYHGQIGFVHLYSIPPCCPVCLRAGTSRLHRDTTEDTLWVVKKGPRLGDGGMPGQRADRGSDLTGTRAGPCPRGEVLGQRAGMPANPICSRSGPAEARGPGVAARRTPGRTGEGQPAGSRGSRRTTRTRARPGPARSWPGTSGGVREGRR